MAASFPINIKIWRSTDQGYPRNLELVLAEHVIQAYSEITAIEEELGEGGLKRSVVDNAVPFNSNTGIAVPSGSNTGFVWGNMSQRLNNLEQGVLDGVNRRVRTAGSSTITPSGASVVGLNIRAASGQTANLLEIRNSSNTVVNRFDSSGQFVGTIDGGTA
jgi:hypothetical protein